MEDYIGECQRMGCEEEATKKGFVLLQPKSEGDAPNFKPALMCENHSGSRHFFKTATQEEIDEKQKERSEQS